MTTITNLPDIPMLNIFSFLSVEDLAKMHLDYAEWKRLQIEVLATRTTLVLVIGTDFEMARSYMTIREPNLSFARLAIALHDNYEATLECRLAYDELDQQTVNMLVDFFPRLTTLQLVLHQATDLDYQNVVQFLNLFGRQLTDFFAGSILVRFLRGFCNLTILSPTRYNTFQS